MTIAEQNRPATGSSGRQGYVVVSLATLMWASSGVLIGYLTRTAGASPLWVAFWRDFLAGLILFAILLVVRPAVLRVSGRDLLFLTAFAVLGLAWVEIVWTYSVAFNGASVATVLAYTAPAFVAVLSWKLFDEPLGWPMIAAIGAVFVGCALVAEIFVSHSMGWKPAEIIVGLTGGLGFAVYGLFGKAAARRGLNSWTTTVYVCSLASFALLGIGGVMALLGHGPAQPVWAVSADPRAWLYLLFLAIVPTLMGDGLYLLGLGYMRVSMASLIASLEPVFTSIAAFVALGERLSQMQLIGSLIIVSAIVAMQIRSE